jgi:uroporphyrinogen decarboxylase
VHEILTDPRKQFEAQVALHTRFNTPFVISAMDLSVEAEEFGCTIRIEGDEVPTVLGRLVEDEAGIRALRIPRIGDKRTRVVLGVVGLLTGLPDRPPVLGGMIGPFSLAGRLFGVSEALLATATDPEIMGLLLEKVTEFLIGYALAFREKGATGIIMAEPAAGLMSPASVSEFSSPYVRRIREAVETGTFTLIFHNCGARIAHLTPSLETGARVFHFGKPMDLVGALEQVPGDTVLCGNLDPSEVFCSSSAVDVAAKTRQLLQAAGDRKNFVLSSGCDIPASCPQENLEAFFSEVRAA